MTHHDADFGSIDYSIVALFVAGQCAHVYGDPFAAEFEARAAKRRADAPDVAVRFLWVPGRGYVRA